jgi:hypothetical protein
MEEELDQWLSKWYSYFTAYMSGNWQTTYLLA